MTEIRIVGLEEAIKRFRGTAKELQDGMNKTMRDSLDVLHENVPRYPPQVVPPSVYRRRVSGGLAGSLGSGEGGGKVGKPDIKQVSKSGNQTQGRFGSTIKYAPYVIDDNRQAYMHRPGYKGRTGWWTMKTIADKATDKITEVWKAFVRVVVKR